MKTSWAWLLCWICVIIFSSVNAQVVISDSIDNNKDSVRKSFRCEGFLATTFFINDNWKGKNNTNILIAGFLHITQRTNSGKFGRINEFRGEISYQKFIDSTWIKNTDNFFISSIWTKKSDRNFRESFQTNLKSQFTNTWDYSFPLSDKPKWKSGPFVPFTFIAGCGFNATINRDSYINVSLITLRIDSKSRIESSNKNLSTIFMTEKIIFNYEQGINLQCALSGKIIRNILFENKTSCFVNGTESKDLKLDMQNILSLKPYGFLKIRFANYLSFDSNISTKIQSKYELLFGYSFDK